MKTSQEVLIEHIEQYRKCKGINYFELSAQLNMPYTTIIEILRGKRMPRLDTVDMIAEAMQVRTCDLLTPILELNESDSLSKSEIAEMLKNVIENLSETKLEMLKVYIKMLQECTFLE